MTKMLRRRMLDAPCRILGPGVKATERNWVVNWDCLDPHLDLNEIAWIWVPPFMKPRISKHANNPSRQICSGFHEEPCGRCPDYEDMSA